MAIAVGALASLHVVALFAEFFAPYPFAAQQRNFAFAPPTRLHWIDRQGKFHWRPFVYETPDGMDGRMQPLHFWVRGYSYRLAGVMPWDRHLFGVDPPGVVFLLGTDGFGRDQFSRLLGGRQSESYVHVNDVRADAYGYGGLTQERRYIQSRAAPRVET